MIWCMGPVPVRQRLNGSILADWPRALVAPLIGNSATCSDQLAGMLELQLVSQPINRQLVCHQPMVIRSGYALILSRKLRAKTYLRIYGFANMATI